MTTTPIPVPDAALPLPDPSDLGTWGARMAEMHRWMREDMRPGMYDLAGVAYENAAYAETMAYMAGVTAGFAGAWSGLSGALNVPASVYYPHVDADYWVLVVSVTNVEAHTPGVSAAFAPFVPSADSVVFDNTGTDLVAETVQAAIVETLDTTVRLVDGAARLPNWTTVGRPVAPGLGDTGRNTTLGCNETWDGAEWVPDRPIVSAALSTASGTAVDLTGIPAWVRELEIVPDDVSLSGTDNLLAQLGTSGGVVTTGYSSASGHTSGGATAATDSAAGFVVFVGLAARTSKGKMTITRVGTTWSATHMVRVEANTVSYGAGDVTISDPVTTLRLTRTGTNTFDGGSFYVVMKP